MLGEHQTQARPNVNVGLTYCRRFHNDWVTALLKAFNYIVHVNSHVLGIAVFT